MTDYVAALRRELVGATEQAKGSGDDPDTVLAAIDRFDRLIKSIDEFRRDASDETKRLLATAMGLGIDPRDLYGRPFSSTIVRDIAKEIGVDVGKRGPRPRSRPVGGGRRHE